MNSFGNPGDFETHEVLGKGAYGTVYRGTNKQNGEVIALKVIDLDHPDNEDINEIQREVALLSQLRDAANHNITLYYGCWIKGMELWIAMDYASGGSIRTLMKAGPIEERFSVVIMREVLIALAYLHKENIIHRDIKAANILLTQTGRILLCDFGVAAHLSTSSKRSTFIGTPYWMAPEVITEGKMYDSKADLWSLGVTVYEVATGNPPYARMEPLRAIAIIPRTEPAKLEGDQWSPAMKEFLALCLTPDPNQRPGAEELSKSRWIRGASRVPTALLRELIVRYGGWVNAGGVRMSIIGDVARRDDTFELDMDRPSSWLFDGEDDLQLGGLGDEPYYDQRSNMNSDFRSAEDAPTARKAPAAQNSHPLMNLFKGNDDADSYGGHSLAASTSSNWVDGDTLRPNSIAIPDLDDSSSGGISLPSFDSNDSGMPAWASGGMSGWAPTSTPWYVASAMSVGKIEREGELVEPESSHSPFGQSDLTSEDGDDSSSGISIPSDLASPTTVRPAWASGAQSSFSMFSNPNPFPKRNRQASNDSSYGPGGSFGGPAVGPAFSSPPQEVEEGFRRTASPDSMRPGSRAGVAASPSLPSLTRARASEEEDEFNTSRTLVSPSSTSPSSSQIRNRANTAPNFDANGNASKAIPEEPLSKGVLNFAKASPFAQARAAMQRRPSALNIADANAASLARAQSPLTPRHGMHLSEDNLLTPMPNASPISPSQTPTTKEYPFPSVTTSPQTALTASTNIRTPLSATTTVRSSISFGDWPTGPNIAPFDYGALCRKVDVQDDLDQVLGQLGDWLAIIDAGMTQILQ